MATYDYSNMIDSNNVIPNSKPAAPMRMSMENKNLLTTKGAIYVGTGTTNTVTINVVDSANVSSTDTYNVAKTASLAPGSDGAVLESNSSSEYGLRWRIKQGVGTFSTWTKRDSNTDWLGVYFTTVTSTEAPILDSVNSSSKVTAQLMMDSDNSYVEGNVIYSASAKSLTIYSNVQYTGSVLITIVQ